MQLPDADAQGRIPYVLTIPAASIPPGVYQVRASARQGDTESVTQTDVKIEAKLIIHEKMTPSAGPDTWVDLHNLHRARWLKPGLRVRI